MVNVFSANEIVQLGIGIEENGKKFYETAAKASRSAAISELFLFLAQQEAQHIRAFKTVLATIEIAGPREAYTADYFAYIRALSGEHVFTKSTKAAETGARVSNDLEALDIAIGFEKDSILFYHEMKTYTLANKHDAIDALITQEREHLMKLTGLKQHIKNNPGGIQ